MVVAVISLISGVQYISYRFSPEYQKIQEVKKMISDYENDPYGGDTPEETLQMFIAALKKGDMDLAARYFVLNEQEKWRGDLKIAKENKHLDLYIDEVSRAKLGKEIYPGNYLFTVAEKGKAVFIISLQQVKTSKKWKIESL